MIPQGKQTLRLFGFPLVLTPRHLYNKGGRSWPCYVKNRTSTIINNRIKSMINDRCGTIAGACFTLKVGSETQSFSFSSTFSQLRLYNTRMQALYQIMENQIMESRSNGKKVLEYFISSEPNSGQLHRVIKFFSTKIYRQTLR